MAQGMEIDIRELSDRRWGVFRDGLCIHVEHNREDAINWWKRTVTAHKDPTTRDKRLNQAIKQ